MGVAYAKILENLMEGTNFDKEEIERLKKKIYEIRQRWLRNHRQKRILNHTRDIVKSFSCKINGRLFVDEDGNGTIDFQEFIMGLSAFSGKTSKLDKLKFAFKIYDIDRDGYIGNGELFIVMKMMVGKNLQDEELQQIVDKTMMEADEDGDGRLNFHEFKNAVDSKSVASALTLNMI